MRAIGPAVLAFQPLLEGADLVLLQAILVDPRGAIVILIAVGVATKRVQMRAVDPAFFAFQPLLEWIGVSGRFFRLVERDKGKKNGVWSHITYWFGRAAAPKMIARRVKGMIVTFMIGKFLQRVYELLNR